jgi:hypothetical protein
MLHNGGFLNGGITERRSHSSTNVSYNDLVSRLRHDKNERNTNLMFLSFQNSICFLIKGNLVSTTVNPFCDADVKKSTVM